MRKNKRDRKGLGVYYVYRVEGLNLDNLVNNLKNRSVSFKDVKKTGNKRLYIAVNHADIENFFAITEEMCYNIKYIRTVGKWRFLLTLRNNLGLLIGALVFLFSAAITDDVIFKVEYTGTGSVYKREIDDYLRGQDVKPLSRFSGIDLPTLADRILAFSDDLSFAECYKCGNRLVVDTALSEKPLKTLGKNTETLASDIDGVIESVKVYRGTALKKAGEPVAVGEEICSGIVVVKDKTVKAGVIATVSVKAKFYYEYYSKTDGDEDLAELFALITLGDKNVISVETEIFPPTEDAACETEADNDYRYKVTVTYRKLFYG